MGRLVAGSSLSTIMDPVGVVSGVIVRRAGTMPINNTFTRSVPCQRQSR